MPWGRQRPPGCSPLAIRGGHSEWGEARGQHGHRLSPTVGKHPNGHGPGQHLLSCCGAMAAPHLDMVPRAGGTAWVLALSRRVVPRGGGRCARLRDGRARSRGAW